MALIFRFFLVIVFCEILEFFYRIKLVFFVNNGFNVVKNVFCEDGNAFREDGNAFPDDGKMISLLVIFKFYREI